MRNKILITLGALLICITTAFAQRQKPVATKVMSFNIRQENKSDKANTWELRFLKVGEFLKKSKADIMGLQEVKHQQLTDLQSMLEGYGNVGVARDDGKKKGEYNPIFYNKEKFDLVNSGTFWLSDTPQEPSRGWDAACNRIATWAILKDKETLRSIIVVNTHLDHVGKQARLNGASLIKERIARMVNDIPVIMTGDFNVDENDPVYSKVTSNYFTLKDAWKVADSTKGKPQTFHDFGRRAEADRKKIDFIFVSPQVKVKKAAIIDTSLGGGLYLSDHNAHTANIVF